MKLRPYSATILAACGVILIGIGLYFILLRPPLLPEDARYAGAPLKDILVVAPGMAQWLGRVFWVMGGYMIATGILTIYLARTSFRTHARRAGLIASLAGITSIGLMAAENIAFNSDFKWPLTAVAILWAMAVLLYCKGK